jgi:drug/metabolite transporter (DMT)-like permease
VTARRAALPIELWAVLYFVSYAPYAVLVRWLSSIPFAPFHRPLTGLEILPATTILSGVFTFLFAWYSGWARQAHHIRVGPMSVPFPTVWTLASGIGTALLLFTVPLSFTFQGVSIPYMQLLMRGDVLIIAPLVDILAGRKVRWYSWAALLLVAIGLWLTIRARGGLHLPALAIVTVVLYTVGYFVRLAVMTRIAKTGDPDTVKRYFVEEKIVAIPLAVFILALLSSVNFGTQSGQLGFGFVGVWSSGQMTPLLILSMLLFVISIFSIMILIDQRENTFCVPIERSSSILAGIAAAYVLASMSLGPAPTPAEITGALLLIAAIVLLSTGPRFSR